VGKLKGFAVVIHAGSIGWRLGKVSLSFFVYLLEMSARNGHSVVIAGRGYATGLQMRALQPNVRVKGVAPGLGRLP